MEIIKFKKLNAGKYKLITDSSEIILYEDVIIKYNLLCKKDIDLELLEKLLKENEYYEVYNLSIKYIEIKMRSKSEIIKYLEKKNFDGKTINEVALKLENIGLLNDKSYIKAFVNDKINLSSMGPLKIKEELIKNKISEEDINDYLKEFDNDIWIGKINKIIDKKVKLNKNKSLFLLKKSIYTNLLFLGYPTELIIECINNVKNDEKDILKKEYEKSYKKLSKKYKDEKLKYMIKADLIKKGFSYENFGEICDE